jgi:hypothetical protein
MGTVTAVSFCSILLFYQPPISQSPLGKPGDPAPRTAPAPAQMAPAPPAPVQQPQPVPAAPAQQQPRPAPMAAQAAPPAASRAGDPTKRVAAFWVVFPN